MERHVYKTNISTTDPLYIIVLANSCMAKLDISSCLRENSETLTRIQSVLYNLYNFYAVATAN